MSDLTAFLEARIAEDEAFAQDCLTKEALTPYSDSRIPAVKPDEWGGLVDNYLGGEMGKYCAHNHPLRALAECKAKRWILGSLASAVKAHGDEKHLGQKLVLAGMDTGLRMALKALAQPYRDHPDFDEDWTL